MLPALEILRESGIVERVNGGQEWKPDLTVRHRVYNRFGTQRLPVEAEWDIPVEGSGPWSWFECYGTRKVSLKQRWSQITRLKAWVNLDAITVETYSVSPGSPYYSPQPIIGPMNSISMVRVYDVDTGEHLITGPLIFITPNPILCPPGWYYRD